MIKMMMGSLSFSPMSPLGLFLEVGATELWHLEVQFENPELVLVDK